MIGADEYQRYLQSHARLREAILRRRQTAPYKQILSVRNTIDELANQDGNSPEFDKALADAGKALKQLARYF